MLIFGEREIAGSSMLFLFVKYGPQCTKKNLKIAVLVAIEINGRARKLGPWSSLIGKISSRLCMGFVWDITWKVLV